MKTPVFQELRTRRLKVVLRELTTGQSIALADSPLEDDQRSLSAFINYATQSVDGVQAITELTVQERLLILCQYISASSESPDFELTNNGHYSDYLYADVDVQIGHETGELLPVTIGEVGGDHWQMRYLTGGMAQSIERLQGEVKLPNGDVLTGFAHWELGCMAAQLFTEQDSLELTHNEGLYDERLIHRMIVFLNFPQSAYAQLRSGFYAGWNQLNHLFQIGLSDKGIVVLPREGDSPLPPARFRVSVILSEAAKNLARQHDKSSA